MKCSSQSVFIVIVIVLIIILVNSVVQQHTISDVMNKTSMGMLSNQIENQHNSYNEELYRDIPDGTKIILANGDILVTPSNSRLVETRNDIILQMGNGDMFIIPDGAMISLPQNKPLARTAKPKPQPKPVAPADAEKKSGFRGGREGFNNELDEEKPLTELSKSYTDDLLKLGIEESVRKQHKNYANERKKMTSTSNYTAVRDDSQDLNPRIGIRRIDYSNIHMDEKTARAIPSQINADQLTKHNNVEWQ